MTVGWWHGDDGADDDGDVGGEPRGPGLSSCDRRSDKFQTRRARSSSRMYPAASRNSSLNHLLQRAATALEPPANVSPQPTLYDPLNTILNRSFFFFCFCFLPLAALSYAFFFFDLLFSDSEFPGLKDNSPSTTLAQSLPK